jgi:cysteine sulfinate desulfinase/cysteine desulfurase-like protein
MAKGALRVSLGRANTEEDVARFLRALGETVNKLKGLAAVAA